MRPLCLVLVLLARPGLAEPVVEVNRLLDDVVPQRLQAMDIPGTAVAVIHDGEIVALRGYGTVDPHSGEAVDPARHVFRVGSVSKPLTATTVLRLFDARGLDLHADLGPQLTDLPLRPPLDAPLAMHHLLSHTAGFSERLFGQHVAAPGRLLDLHGYLRSHLPPRFIAPGEVIAYNDHHTVLAAWLAERVGGVPFAALAERLVLEPLGMASTTFRQVDQPPAVVDHLTRAWHRTGGGWRAYAPDYVHTTPAAGAFSSAADMGRYLAALLDCRHAPLEADVCERQLARQAAHHARLPGRAYGFAEGRHGALRVLFKDGQASGFNARLLLVPEAGFGMFVVHNRNILGPFGRFEPAARFNREVTGAVLAALYPVAKPAAVAPQPAAGAAERVAGYAGDYRNVVAARHTWERVAGMFDDVHVSATARGVDFGYGEFVETSPGLVQWHEGGERYAAFRRGDGVASHLFIGSGAYERIPWYVASWFTPGFLLAMSMWFAATTVLSGRRVRGWRRLRECLPGTAFLGFLLGFAALLALTDVQTLFRGAPAPLRVVLALPLIAAAGLAAQAWGLVTDFRRHGAAGQALVTAELAAGGVFLLWLDYWNLLGYRLG